MAKTKSQYLSVLKEMDMKRKREDHPNFPPDYIPETKFSDKTANGLTKCIIRFIQCVDGQAERINTTGRIINTKRKVTDVHGATREIGSVSFGKSTSTKGSADISATIKGRSVKIEVKIGRDRMSEHQKKYQKQIERAGGIYYIARDFDSFYIWYNQVFNELPF